MIEQGPRAQSRAIDDRLLGHRHRRRNICEVDGLDPGAGETRINRGGGSERRPNAVNLRGSRRTNGHDNRAGLSGVHLRHPRPGIACGFGTVNGNHIDERRRPRTDNPPAFHFLDQHSQPHVLTLPFDRERNRNGHREAVDGVYVNDAYHSLSIEGYRVSPELIERVRRSAWNPDQNAEDRENRNALAARGYYDAFVSVTASVERVLRGGNAGTVARDGHREWYRQLLGPSVTAGIITAADLAGYRTGPVHIRRSMHVPPPREAVRDCMPVLFELLEAETEPAVRVVLGHFIFVYIHPYMDG